MALPNSNKSIIHQRNNIYFHYGHQKSTFTSERNTWCLDSLDTFIFTELYKRDIFLHARPFSQRVTDSVLLYSERRIYY